jgi:hypothetical protein
MAASPVIRASTVPTATNNPTSPAGTLFGDLVLVCMLTRGTTVAVTHTVQAGFTTIRSTDIDNSGTFARLSVAYKVATVGGATGYNAYVSNTGTDYAGIVVLKRGTWNEDNITSGLNSQFSVSANPPDPAAVTTQMGIEKVFTFAGWWLTSAATVVVTPPTDYTEEWEMAGSQNVELACAYRDVPVNGSENPGAFADDVTPDATVSITIGFRAPVTTYPVPRGSTAATATNTPTSPADTEIGDLVVVQHWTRGGAGVPVHTLQSGFTEIRSHSHDDGSTDGRLSVAYKVATVAGAQTYNAYTSDVGTDYAGILVLRAMSYHRVLVGDISASATSTNNSPPDPPSVTTGQANCLVVAIGAWHLSSAATVAVTPPANYTEEWEMAGSLDSELACTWRKIAAAGAENPAAFADDVAPSGTVGMTIAFRPDTDQSWVADETRPPWFVGLPVSVGPSSGPPSLVVVADPGLAWMAPSQAPPVPAAWSPFTASSGPPPTAPAADPGLAWMTPAPVLPWPTAWTSRSDSSGPPPAVPDLAWMTPSGAPAAARAAWSQYSDSSGPPLELVAAPAPGLGWMSAPLLAAGPSTWHHAGAAVSGPPPTTPSGAAPSGADELEYPDAFPLMHSRGELGPRMRVKSKNR